MKLVMGWLSSIYDDYFADIECLKEHGGDSIMTGSSVMFMWLGSLLNIDVILLNPSLTEEAAVEVLGLTTAHAIWTALVMPTTNFFCIVTKLAAIGQRIDEMDKLKGRKPPNDSDDVSFMVQPPPLLLPSLPKRIQIRKLNIPHVCDDAMHDEMEALNQNCTWTLVPRPSASNIVAKYATDGFTLVHCGFNRVTPLAANEVVCEGGSLFAILTFYRSLVELCNTSPSIGLIYLSMKQPTVSRSSCESEYHAMANTAAEIIWITDLLRELHALPPD
ncbi:uncharacterized mitochondrial protein-like protein [Tanacetum coccineum]|uniref:Uncharacterized mitochondrial protein-like protein n=1 Tax=Tanacetum coccineum TaxID=301880 RepID=A0ABQ4ZM74_9ASTR